jgi:hypothetical protein
MDHYAAGYAGRLSGNRVAFTVVCRCFAPVVLALAARL